MAKNFAATFILRSVRLSLCSERSLA